MTSPRRFGPTKEIITTAYQLSAAAVEELGQLLDMRTVRGRTVTGSPNIISYTNPGPGGVGTGAGTVAKNVTAEWVGTIPTVLGKGVVHIVPKKDGASATWTLTSAVARVESPPLVIPAVFVIEKSSGSGAFSLTPTIVATLIVAVGTYEVAAAASTSVTTGDKLRLRFAQLGGIPGILYGIETQSG